MVTNLPDAIVIIKEQARIIEELKEQVLKFIRLEERITKLSSRCSIRKCDIITIINHSKR